MSIFLVTYLVLMALAAGSQLADPDQLQRPLQHLDSTFVVPPFKHHCYHSHYPPQSSWLSFPALWDINRETILSANSGDVYLQHYLHEALEQVSKESGLNPSFLLVLVMQKTRGDVKAPCFGEDPYCGLLQVYKGFTFDAARPEASIARMLKEGVEGVKERGWDVFESLFGEQTIVQCGLGQTFAAISTLFSRKLEEKYLQQESGDHGSQAFVNDLANRLMGWDGTGEGYAQCIQN